MKQTKQEIGGILCSFYLIVLFVILPLYTGGSYYLLGDRKYGIFRNATVLSLGLWIVVTLVSVVSERKYEHFSLGIVDKVMLFYGGSVLLSALLSPFPKTACFGYRDWYMGAVTQLLLVGVYFLVSRCYSGSGIPVYLGEAALFLVIVIGLLQRLRIDPLQLHAVFPENYWEYSHMLSTVGNINWLSSYLGMLLPFTVTGFWYAKTRLKKGLLYADSVACLLLLWVQGSDSGIVIVFLCFGILLFQCRKEEDKLPDFLLLAMGMSMVVPVYAQLIKWQNSIAAMPADGQSYARIARREWWFAAALMLLLYVVCRLLPKLRSALMNYFLFPAFCLGILAGVFYAITVLSNVDGGNGRLALWQLAINGYRTGSPVQKLIGFGPDCFAHVAKTTEVLQEGYWEGAVFTNAHNEWLNQLVNIGVLGTTAYFTVFCCAIKRYRQMLLGTMAVVIYFVCSLFGFQEVMNAPFLFLILGLCENRMKKYEKIK